MSADWLNCRPQRPPPLDPDFLPLALAFRAWRREGERTAGSRLILALERPDKSGTRFEVNLPGEAERGRGADSVLAERLLKSLLWTRGGCSLWLCGPEDLVEDLERTYSPGGGRDFDRAFLGQTVYRRPFRILRCALDSVPEARERGQRLGGFQEGFRVGFDLGGSDLKVVALAESQVVWSAELPWNPGQEADPTYHYTQIRDAIRRAAGHLPQLDVIGGSSAGIYIDNRCRVGSLFQAVPAEHRAQMEGLFPRLEKEFGVPLVVINDGTAAALGGAVSLRSGAVLGIAMGSSEAGGYVTPELLVPSSLDELAFVPIDLQPNAPVDPWSGDRGVGAQYLSQQAVFRLAAKAGVKPPPAETNVARLGWFLGQLADGDSRVLRIFETIGTYTGYAIAWYAELYDLRHVFLLGRVTSGAAGPVLLDQARQVLWREFPELAGTLRIHLPEEHARRLGQAETAAGLLPVG